MVNVPIYSLGYNGSACFGNFIALKKILDEKFKGDAEAGTYVYKCQPSKIYAHCQSATLDFLGISLTVKPPFKHKRKNENEEEK